MDNIIELAARANELTRTSPYGYTPSKEAAIAYLVVFAVATVVHVGLAIKYKYWIAFATLVPGGLLEVLGWAGRYWSSNDVLKTPPFLMQICCLILGPAFFSAWAYTILGYCITRLGTAYSLLSPRMYLMVFVAADIVSLVLQAIGGGQAAVAAQNGTDTTKSTHIMLAGILFQLVTMTLFVALASDFIGRVIFRRPYTRRIPFLHAGLPAQHIQPTSISSTSPTPSANGDIEKTTNAPTTIENDSRTLRKAKILLLGVAFASLMIYIRGIYRSIELAQGWRGYLITHEEFFNYLDGLPMILCLAGLAVTHPGFLLPRRAGWKNA